MLTHAVKIDVHAGVFQDHPRIQPFGYQVLAADGLSTTAFPQVARLVVFPELDGEQYQSTQGGGHAEIL
jgi:hypothetical protein